MFPFGFGIRHTGTHPGADHGQFQLTEYPGDLQEGFCHRVHLPIPAVHSNTADNNQPQPFVPDHIDDLTKLLCRTGQPGDFQCESRVEQELGKSGSNAAKDMTKQARQGADQGGGLDVR